LASKNKVGNIETATIKTESRLIKFFITMKSKFLISLAIVSIAMITLTFSCSDPIQENEEINANLDLMVLNEGIFDEPTLFGDNIYLPEGTHWYYSNEMRDEIVFELPEKYVFLMKNTETEKYELSSRIAGYSCTCTKGGCTVFHNKTLGYGCLQGDCEGSCTGAPSQTISPNLQIAGVLNAKNNEVEAGNLERIERASLSRDGMKGFLEIREVQKAIIDTYNGFYDNVLFKIEKPNFESEIYDIEKYVYLKAIIYGMEIGMIVPRDAIDFLQDIFPNERLEVSNLLNSDTPSSCACSGGSQGGNCELQKNGALKYTFYYCSGCTTCTMN